MQSSTTDAETQKLTGVLVAQSSELAAIDQELSFAAYQAVLQDIENRNDERRQEQAEREEFEANQADAFQKGLSLLLPDTEGGFRKVR